MWSPCTRLSSTGWRCISVKRFCLFSQQGRAHTAVHAQSLPGWSSKSSRLCADCKEYIFGYGGVGVMDGPTKNSFAIICVASYYVIHSIFHIAWYCMISWSHMCAPARYIARSWSHGDHGACSCRLSGRGTRWFWVTTQVIIGASNAHVAQQWRVPRNVRIVWALNILWTYQRSLSVVIS